MYGSYGNNNCQTAHPTVATSMTMSRQYSGRMFHSPAVGTLWGRRGPAESVVEKNPAMMMSRTYWYGNNSQTAQPIRNTPPPPRGLRQQVSVPVQQSVATSMNVIGRPVVGTPCGRGPAESVFCAQISNNRPKIPKSRKNSSTGTDRLLIYPVKKQWGYDRVTIL